MIKKKINNILKYSFKKIGYNVVKISNNTTFRRNVFGKSYSKRALVSIQDASKDDLTRVKHTCFAETWLIAEALDELRYQVDTVRYRESLSLDRLMKYDFIIGYGEPVNHLLTKGPPSRPLTVCYSTGCHLVWQRHQTAKRLKQAFEQKDAVFRESWRVDDCWWHAPYHFADAVIVTGNEHTASTYAPYTMSPVYPVSLFAFNTVNLNIDDKDYDVSKSKYLWFGGGSLVHKGLDLVIDYFLERPDLELHIGGNIEREPRFCEYYMPKIKSSRNIDYHGFIDLRSEKFSDLMYETAFVIVPSCSEGGCASVLTPMVNGGLIPIVTPACGVDIEDYGIHIEGFQVKDIKNAITKSESLSVSEIMDRSHHILKKKSSEYSQDAFKERIHQAVSACLSAPYSLRPENPKKTA